MMLILLRTHMRSLLVMRKLRRLMTSTSKMTADILLRIMLLLRTLLLLRILLLLRTLTMVMHKILCIR